MTIAVNIESLEDSFVEYKATTRSEEQKWA
jgi:hypothetical protein